MKIGLLHLQDLDRNYVAIVQLKTQPPGVLQQVTLRKDKVHDGLIRLGETTDDEARCWIDPQYIEVVSLLATAEEKDGKWIARPIPYEVTEEEAYAMACP